MLLEMGINPNTYFGSVAFAGGHDKVVEGVLNRTYEAGAISDNVLPELQRVRGMKVEDLEIVARTTPIPQSVIAVRTGVDEAVRERIRYVMTEMGYNVEGRAILGASSLGMQGFAPIGAQDFEATRKIVTLVDSMPTDTKKP